jgi:hypothetical protein
VLELSAFVTVIPVSFGDWRRRRDKFRNLGNTDPTKLNITGMNLFQEPVGTLTLLSRQKAGIAEGTPG